jgi:peptidylprolyl isomerase
MHIPRLRPRPLIAACALLVLAGCGSDELATPAPATSAAAATALPSSCTPAPAVTAPAADSFTDTVCLTTLPDGLQFGDVVTGTGATPATGKTLTADYTGWLSNGTMFDTSHKAGASPITFVMGDPAGVIAGWNEGLLTMHVGGKRRLVIPPALGYGSTSRGSIPPNATLTFEVTLLSVA